MKDRLVGGAVLVVLAAAVTALSGRAETVPQEVNIQFAAYAPSQIDVLPGETVSWTNVSQRTHTVTSDTGRFDSDEVIGGGHYSHRFDEVGAYAYHCTIHPSIVGEIDVRRVTFDRVPPSAVPVGTRVELTGRTADPGQPVLIEEATGTDVKLVGKASPAADGSWKTVVTAVATTDLRAVSGSDRSETRRLLVASRRVVVRPTKTGVSVTVTPSAPYARLLVEVYLPERFGWWPVAQGTVNYLSVADIRVRRPARVRVVLVDKDGWTPLATSPTIILRKASS